MCHAFFWSLALYPRIKQMHVPALMGSHSNRRTQTISNRNVCGVRRAKRTKQSESQCPGVQVWPRWARERTRKPVRACAGNSRESWTRDALMLPLLSVSHSLQHSLSLNLLGVAQINSSTDGLEPHFCGYWLFFPCDYWRSEVHTSFSGQRAKEEKEPETHHRFRGWVRLPRSRTTVFSELQPWRSVFIRERRDMVNGPWAEQAGPRAWKQFGTWRQCYKKTFSSFGLFILTFKYVHCLYHYKGNIYL